jgi:hypothetical protein
MKGVERGGREAIRKKRKKERKGREATPGFLKHPQFPSLIFLEISLIEGCL